MENFNGRGSYKVTLDNNQITLSKPTKTISFNLDDISDIQINKSVYDIPFLEKTVTIRLKNGQKYTIKRLPKKQAEKLYSSLT